MCAGKLFKVLFSYKAAYKGELSLTKGEIVEGKERDRNGWMLGKKKTDGKEGWFPAVYVDEIKKEETVTITKNDEAKFSSSSNLDRDVYGILAVNRTKSPDQSWVAIGMLILVPSLNDFICLLCYRKQHFEAICL